MSLKKKAAKASMWSILESLGVRVIMFTSGIVLARLLDPEDFGLMAMLFVFIHLSQSLSNGGFQDALVQKKDLTELDINSVFFFNFGIGTALSFTFFFSSNAIASFFEQPKLIDIVQIMSVIPVLNALNIVQYAIAKKELNMKKMARSTIFSNLVSMCICIYMALIGFGVWSLVAQQIAAAAFLFIALWYRSAWYPKAQFSLKSIKQMFNYSSKLLTADFIAQFFKNIYYIVIGKLFSADQLGFYSRGDNLRKFVSDTLARTIERVTFPVFSKVQDDMERAKRIMQKSFCTSSFVTFPAMLGLASIAEELIPLLLTNKWSPSIPFFQLLCIVGMFAPMQTISNSGYKALGLAGLVLRLTIIKNILVVAGILATYKFGLIAIVIGQVAVIFLCYLIDTYYNQRVIGYPIKQQLKDILPFLGASLLMVLCINWLGMQLSTNLLTTMLVKLLVGAVIYTSCLTLIKNPVMRESFELFKAALEK